MIVYDSIEQVDLTLWKFKGHSTLTPPVTLRVYVAGRLYLNAFVSADGTFEFEVNVGNATSPFVEVLDEACLRPEYAYPGQWDLHWYWSQPDASSFRVEQFVGAAWVEKGTVPYYVDGYFTWRTPWLADVTVHQFRVVAITIGGLEALPIPFTAEMVRHPDVPDQNFSYSAGTGKVTVS